MTQSFDEFIKEYKTDHGCLPSRKWSYEAGAQSQQAEVDDKFIANCKLTDHIHILQRERDALQKRIDEALRALYERDKTKEYRIEKVAKILKGKENDTN